MRLKVLCAAAIFAVSSPLARADEGMWTFDNFPADKVEAAYGHKPDQAWMDMIAKAAVRLESGCSGSVVSRDGLVLTNHHCIADCAQDLSSARADLIQDGFQATARRDERVCPGMEASILQSITDVTDLVREAGAHEGEDGATSRAAEMARIETEACGDDGDKHCEVVTLYRGGQYKLYKYDRYKDVRLVFAPERQMAFFGGDPDNFNFPRYAFDVALLRLYKDGKITRFRDPLKIEPKGATEGEVSYVAGHPGSTNRLLTIAQLNFQRDQFLPWRVEYLAQIRGSLLTAANIGDEEQRQLSESLLGVENSVKVYKGRRGALVEPSFYALRKAEEDELRRRLASDGALRAAHGDPFVDIEKIVANQKSLWMPHQILESSFGAGSVLMNDARTLVRAASETRKESNERLPEYASNRLARIERNLLAQTQIHPVLEQLLIEFWLNKTREYLGPDHPAVKELFGSSSAHGIAIELVSNTTLDDPRVRERLWKNPDQIAGSNDPAIVLARRIDKAARAARTAYEEKVDIPLVDATERLADLRFVILGDSVYPDATFTLRMSYCKVTGWNDPAFGEVPAFTSVGGLWGRATGAFPFNLVPTWAAAMNKLAPESQMNFVSTNDVIGGNSGSPVLDRRGRVVGLAFDGNIHSLGGAYGYDKELNRMVSVSSQLIINGLRDVYGAKSLVDELLR